MTTRRTTSNKRDRERVKREKADARHSRRAQRAEKTTTALEVSADDEDSSDQ
jgi:hypothetical protein